MMLTAAIAGAQNDRSPTLVITGKVFDATTQSPIDFANIYLVGTTAGTNTGPDGSFLLETISIGDSLEVSQLGYTTVKVKLNPAHLTDLVFELQEASLELAEVVITADIDPGKKLVEKVIARKPYNDPDQLGNYSYLQYTRAELDLNNVKKESRNQKSIKALMLNHFDQLDTANLKAGQLPIYFSETLTQNFHSISSPIDEEVTVAKKALDLPTDKLLRHLEKFNVRFNVYDNWLKVFEKTFAGPIADHGPDFYHYYIEDSLQVNGQLQIKVQFVPKYKYSETFTGMMWINDSTYSVSRMEFHMDKTANLNFVKAIQYAEDFAWQSPADGSAPLYMPKKINAEVTFESGLDLLGIPVNSAPDKQQLTYKNTSVLDKIVLEEKPSSKSYRPAGAPTKMDHMEQSEAFWEVNRLDSLSVHERSIYQMTDSIRNNPRFKLTTRLIASLSTGYWDLGSKGKWSLGHYASAMSSNPLEGLRFRLGIRSNAAFDEHWHTSGYLAYGQGDNQFKGALEVGYLGSTEPWSKTVISARSDYDVLLSIDEELEDDNIISSFFRKKDIVYKRNYVRELKVYHEQQFGRNWRNKLSLAYREYDPSFDFTYYASNTDLNGGMETPRHTIPVLEAGASFRWSLGEKMVNENFAMTSLDLPTLFPILRLNYTHGFKALDAPFSYDKLNFGVSQFVNLPPKSLLFYNLQVGQTFGTLPYLLLDIPTGSDAYVVNRDAFSTMIPYEFVADRFVSFKSRLSLGGLVLDKFPLLQRLGWRERLSFNAFWGDLSSANRDFNQFQPIKTIGSKPFAEVGVGLENIFHVLSLEYFWRLNYLDDSHTDHGAFFAGVTLAF